MLSLAFCLLLSVKIIKLYFSPAPLGMKVLSMILVGSLVYNLLEVSLFYSADIRAFMFYILAGAVLAAYRDYVVVTPCEETRQPA